MNNKIAAMYGRLAKALNDLNEADECPLPDGSDPLLVDGLSGSVYLNSDGVWEVAE